MSTFHALMQLGFLVSYSSENAIRLTNALLIKRYKPTCMMVTGKILVPLKHSTMQISGLLKSQYQISGRCKVEP